MPSSVTFKKTIHRAVIFYTVTLRESGKPVKTLYEDVDYAKAKTIFDKQFIRLAPEKGS